MVINIIHSVFHWRIHTIAAVSRLAHAMLTDLVQDQSWKTSFSQPNCPHCSIGLSCPLEFPVSKAEG